MSLVIHSCSFLCPCGSYCAGGISEGLGLNTVELLKTASSALNIGPAQAMAVGGAAVSAHESLSCMRKLTVRPHDSLGVAGIYNVLGLNTVELLKTASSALNI